ncbi:MAG: hypothetical protein JW807_09045 [Spirochaetes bacterium]|nr:hypothetical protein [Spirochaetota bacterium]
MRNGLLLLALPLMIACASLPRLEPYGSEEGNDCGRKCFAPFLCGRWRLVHSINGTLPGGLRATMIGVTVADSETGRLRCSLMSIEGLVLLDAEYDGKLTIHRGIGPLGSPGMVLGMLRDIRLMLFRPKGGAVAAGVLENGRNACRYTTPEGTVDVVITGDGGFEVRSYDSCSRLSRTLRLAGVNREGIPAAIELDARGMFGYSLQLDLIEASPVR